MINDNDIGYKNDENNNNNDIDAIIMTFIHILIRILTILYFNNTDKNADNNDN